MPTDHASERRGIDWNMLTALIAVLVGALALGVSVYTARLQQLQVRAEVWPHLGLSFPSDQRMLLLENKGVGPAMLQWVTVAVDGNTVTDWPSLFQRLGLGTEAVGELRTTSLEPRIIGAGEVVQALHFGTEAGWAAFLEARSAMRLTLCYCSVLNECRVRGAEAGAAAQQDWLDACPAPPRDPFRG